MIYLTIENNDSDGNHRIDMRQMDGEAEGDGVAITVVSANATKHIPITLETSEAREVGRWLLKNSGGSDDEKEVAE